MEKDILFGTTNGQEVDSMTKRTSRRDSRRNLAPKVTVATLSGGVREVTARVEGKVVATRKSTEKKFTFMRRHGLNTHQKDLVKAVIMQKL